MPVGTKSVAMTATSCLSACCVVGVRHQPPSQVGHGGVKCPARRRSGQRSRRAVAVKAVHGQPGSSSSVEGNIARSGISSPGGYSSMSARDAEQTICRRSYHRARCRLCRYELGESSGRRSGSEAAPRRFMPRAARRRRINIAAPGQVGWRLARSCRASSGRRRRYTARNTS